MTGKSTEEAHRRLYVGPFAEVGLRRYARDMRLPGTFHALGLGLVLAALCLLGQPGHGSAQRVARVSETLYREVMPEAERFGPVEGAPPVIRAFRGEGADEALVGFVFLTSDLPPEQFGYSGPIEALVGMRPDGTLTGMRVTDYMESYMRSMGDFLRTPGFQEQFAGKHIGDPFQLWNDVDGISRVSISIRALSRGVRDAARRVAAEYGVVEADFSSAEVVDPVGLSWFELRQRGLVERFEVTEPGEGSAGIALVHIDGDRMGEYLLGELLYERALRSAERRGGADNLMLYAIDGSRLRLFRQDGWSLVQGDVETAIPRENVVSLGLPSGGVVHSEATMVGLMLVGPEVDFSQPFVFRYDLGDLGVHEVDYTSQEARVLAAEVAAARPRPTVTDEVPVAPESNEETVEEVADSGADVAASEAADIPASEAADPPATAPVSAPGTAAEDRLSETDREGGAPRAESDSLAVVSAEAQEPTLDFVLTEDESVLERILAGTVWSRVWMMAGILLLGLAAFVTKSPVVGLASTVATVVVLGFWDGGFLSVSHITGGIWAGVGVYLRDLPLLMIVLFTLFTTLIWGRVFCGFLCPFGALQDLLDRVVPKRWQRPVPDAVHDKAVWVKYLILAIVVIPPLLGSQLSLYQYFEPFGTVFFLSPSIGLWAIALGFIGASLVVPRFYCRYACPLGAALALGSVIALRRIPRVEHCTHCKVCEHACPVGAIRSAEIDFKECVRCNMCEVLLAEKAGVCQHDMDEIRPRLVQLEVSRG